MRNHLAIEAGTYAECQPDGRWICQREGGDPVQTSWAVIPAPALGLITARLDPVNGSHRICGHEASGTHVTLYDGAWIQGAVTGSGGDSTAFGPTGTWYWNPDWDSVQSKDGPLIAGPNVAAGGIRHVVSENGLDVPRIIAYTYSHPTLNVSAYTEIGDIIVGQGNVVGGVLIIYKGKRYQLDSGFCWYVRFNRQGDQLAIAYWKLHERRAICEWLTVQDLASLPLEPEPPIEVRPYNRMLPQFAYYTYDAGRGYGNYPNEVLHAAWCETAADVAQANSHDQYVVTSPELIVRAKYKAFAMVANDYASAPPIQQQIDEAVPTCLAYGIRLLVYDEKRENPKMPDWTIVAVRCYRLPGEPLDVWKAVTNDAINAVPDFEVCPLFGVDDRNGQLTESVLQETALAATDILRDNLKAVMCGWFSYARTKMDNGQHVPPGGAILYPKVWEVVKKSQAASGEINWDFYRIPEDTDPPEEPITMPYVMVTAQTPGDPVVHVTKITEETKGGELYLNRSDGRKLSMTDQGKVEDRNPDAYGPWEQWIKTGKGYVSKAHGEKFGILAL